MNYKMIAMKITLPLLLAGLCLIPTVQAADSKQVKSGGQFNEARDFLMSRMIGIDACYAEPEPYTHIRHCWQLKSGEFSKQIWRWTESYQAWNTSRPVENQHMGAPFEGSEQYTVDPRELSTHVSVATFGSGAKITFECATAKCIYMDQRSGGMPSQNNAKNNWTFHNEEDAQRVAKALQVMLKEAGAKESNF